jgi:hypothetical protein
MHREPYPGDEAEGFPEPPSSQDSTLEEVRDWLRDLEQFGSRSGLSADVQARVREHMETAHLWIDWIQRG